MAKKSQRSKAQKKARKIEDLPARQKGKNIKGGTNVEIFLGSGPPRDQTSNFSK